jgi:RNA polymerase-binding transcription factor
MTKTEIKAFQRALEYQQTEMGNGTRNREALAIETSPDEFDRIQHASERDHAMGILELSSKRLAEVRAALLRINAGTYGMCLGCEEGILPKRLTAVPWTSFCIVCQEAADRGQETSGNEIETSLTMAA